VINTERSKGGSKGIGLPRLTNIKSQMIEKLQNKSKIPDYLKSQLDTLNEKTLQTSLQGTSTEAYATAAKKLA
jgi:hypothetical protein